MEKLFKKLASHYEEAFRSEIDFSDGGKTAKTSFSVLDKLDKFKIGPKALILLVVFCFPEEKREKIWKKINKVIKENK